MAAVVASVSSHAAPKTPRESKTGACIQECGLGCGIRAVLVRSLVDESATREPSDNAALHASNDGIELARTWWRSLDKSSTSVEGEYAVEHGQVHVWMKIEATTKPLDKGDSSCPRVYDMRDANIVRGRRFAEDPRARGEHVGAERRKSAQFKRQ